MKKAGSSDSLVHCNSFLSPTDSSHLSSPHTTQSLPGEEAVLCVEGSDVGESLQLTDVQLGAWQGCKTKRNDCSHRDLDNSGHPNSAVT